MTFIIILLAVLCVEFGLALSLFFTRLKPVSCGCTHTQRNAENESGERPDEPQRTEEQIKAEQMMMDGINNILSYNFETAMGGDGK